MDAFCASVEQHDDPLLCGKPVIVAVSVGGAASCPPRPLNRYAEVSAAAFAAFRRYTPLAEGVCLEEAFLDVTENWSLSGEGEEVARRIPGGLSALPPSPVHLCPRMPDGSRRFNRESAFFFGVRSTLLVRGTL